MNPPRLAATNDPGPSAEVINSQVVLRVDHPGQVSIAGRIYSLTALRTYLLETARVAGGTSRMEVLILADRNTSYEEVYRVLTCAREAGCRRLKMRARR